MEVAILMSTYNGEKYLSTQIYSLINQDFKNWKLYIRDDGSSDNTVELIKKYTNLDNRIKYVYDDEKGLKPAKSFFKLLKFAKADYYFFSDQDDFWLPNKLSLMLSKCAANEKGFPQLVYCDLKCVDSNLIHIQSGFEKIIGKCYGKNRFIGNDMPGCVMLINRKLRDLTIKYLPSNGFIMHDWWIALVAEVFGEIIFLNKKLVYYRQHGNNTVGAGKKGTDFKKMFGKKAIFKQKKLVYQTFVQNKTFFDSFSDNLPQEYNIFLTDFIECKQENCFDRIKFFRKYDLKEINILRTLSYRILFSIQLNYILKDKRF